MAVAISLFAGQLNAQENGRRVYDEQLRVKFDEQIPEAREIGLDAGGWFSFAFFHYDDASATTERTLRQYELRLYAKANIQGVHQFYIRGVTGYEDWNKGDNPKDYRGDAFNEPKVERAWYQLDLGRMLQLQTGQKPPVGFKFKAGRAFAKIGTALVLSMPLDMVQFDLSLGNWELMALLGKSLSRTSNIDNSPAVSTHQRRCFWGMQASYGGFDHHKPFVYFLDNEDHTRPDPFDPRQSYQYNSYYIGFGSKGVLLPPNLRYQTELVLERGKTYSNNVISGRDRIDAFAMDLLLEYLFQRKGHPKVMVEYLFGSGDNDRLTSATSTVGGNAAGTRDHAFNAFGFRDTGIAFAPKISNLHIFILGASIFPLEDHRIFEKMEVGSKVFFYSKEASSGPISDSTATNSSQWVGWEWDIFCDWRITSDVSWTIRYGAFQPGAAFDDRTCRQFLYTGLTFSF